MRSGTFLYGKTKYDHDNGCMSFIKPRQIIKIENLELEEKGFIIYMHEDFLIKHNLHSEIKKYSYFDYEVNEALHLSPKEEEIVWDLFYKIQSEYHNNQDEYSKDIIVAHIDSILKYSQRFYKRQFLIELHFQGQLFPSCIFKTSECTITESQKYNFFFGYFLQHRINIFRTLLISHWLRSNF